MSVISQVTATRERVSVGIDVGARDAFLKVHLCRNVESGDPTDLDISAPSTSGDVRWYRAYARGLTLACEVHDELESAMLLDRPDIDPPIRYRPDYVIAAYLLWKRHLFAYKRGRAIKPDDPETLLDLNGMIGVAETYARGGK